MTSKKTNPLPIPNQGPEKSVAQLEKEIRQLKKKLEMAELENDFLRKRRLSSTAKRIREYILKKASVNSRLFVYAGG